MIKAQNTAKAVFKVLKTTSLLINVQTIRKGTIEGRNMRKAFLMAAVCCEYEDRARQ